MTTAKDRIAIVGIAGRFPGAPDIETFWRNLCAGVESVRSFSETELRQAGVDPRVTTDPDFVNAGAPLDDADSFDASFFGINPREAELMDPQHRIFLESAWAVLEDAGCDPSRFAGQIGVFGAVARNTYFLHNVLVYRDLIRRGATYEATLGSDKDFPATRVAYKLNLTGPAFSVQSACSSSGVALHLACQSLLNGECDAAIVGGARVHVPQTAGYLWVEGGIPSRDGHCRPFDERAQGCIYGSGVATVLLKRLEDAIENRDRIYSVILATALNNDGADKAGFTAPSVSGQARVVAEALAVSSVDADSIQYVEAHGTGTTLGDPIEVAALTRAYRQKTSAVQYCGLGSLKGNIGHLDAGAGVAGLIKLSLMLSRQKLVPSINFTRPNPELKLESTPFYVNTEFKDWTRPGGPRRGAISSFGLGGTNFHAILEEAPEPEGSTAARPAEILLLSARTPTALSRSAENLASFLESSPALNLSDVAFTLATGRQSLQIRQFVACQDLSSAVSKLRQVAAPSKSLPRATRHVSNTVFMFTGQGSQYPRMTAGLYDQDPVFRRAIDDCCEGLQPHLSLDLRAVIYCRDSDRENAEKALNETRLTQPALFAVEYALAKSLQARGVTPSALVGHSVGELVAATLGGVFRFEDALAIVAARAALMQDAPTGRMLAVQLSAEYVRPLLPAELEIAAVNSPKLVVVSGLDRDIVAFQAALDAREVSWSPVRTSHAFHSRLMESAAARFTEVVGRFPLNVPEVPIASNVTGSWLKDAEAIQPAYWGSHIRQPVLFDRCLETLLALENPAFMEVGPGRTLASFAKQKFGLSRSFPIISCARDARSDADDQLTLLAAYGELWAHGANLDPGLLFAGSERRKVSLPTYPFERRRYWLSSDEVGANSNVQAPVAGPSSKQEIHDMAPRAGVSGEGRSDSASSNAASTLVLEKLRNLLHELSGVDANSLNPDATFLELGFDSLFLTRARVEIQRRLKVTLAFRQFFEDTPTLRSLAQSLASQVSEIVSAAPLPATVSSVPDANLHPATASSADPKNTATAELKSLLSELTGINAGSLQDSKTLVELGLDSLLITRLVAEMKKRFGVRVLFRRLFEDLTTINDIASFLAHEAADRFAARTAPPLPTSAIETAPARRAAAPAPEVPGNLAAMGQLIQRQLELMKQQVDLLSQQVPGAMTANPVANSGERPVRLAQAPETFGRKVKGFGPFKPVKAALAHSLSESQKKYIGQTLAKYNERTVSSKNHAERHRRYLADPRTVSGFRREWKEAIYPIVTKSSAGCRIVDVDGNEYVDIVMGFGSHLFGHSPTFLREAMRKTLDTDMAVGPQSTLAAEGARLFCDMTGAERMTYAQSGSEAVLGALRIARAVTGKDRIAIFSGSYHGRLDCVGARPTVVNGRIRPVAVVPGIPDHMVSDTLVLDYGDPASLEIIRDFADELAAVLVEPVQSRNPTNQPREFVHQLRSVTEQHDIALVFDEMITGFRSHPGGAQAWYGVRADIATYGKAVAGAMPLAVVAGKAHYLDALDGGTWHFGDESFPRVGVTFLGGTFVRHPLAVAAMHAVLRHMEERGPQLQGDLNALTQSLADRLNAYFRDRRYPVQIDHFSSLFNLNCQEPFTYSGLLFPLLRSKGLHCYEDWPCFLSTAHTASDVNAICERVMEACEELAGAGLIGEASGAVPGRISAVAGGVAKVDHEPVAQVLTDNIRNAPLTAAVINTEEFGRVRALLDRLCTAIVVDLLRSSGIQLRVGATLSRTQVKTTLAVRAPYDKLVDYFFKMLRDDALIEGDSRDNPKVTGAMSAVKSPKTLAAEIRRQYPSFGALCELLEYCAAALPQVLRGEIPGVSVLLPDGTRTMIKEVLQARTPDYRGVGNVQDVLARELLKLAAIRPLRILEVGGGGGDLTWRIAPRLPASVHYHFTDLSPTLVADARGLGRSVDGAKMSYSVVDVTKSLPEQGIAPASFDVVLALNVIHATPDVANTLRNLFAALAPGGIVCAVEHVGTYRWDQIIWGLTPQWWLFDDSIRKDAPLLDLAEWRQAVAPLNPESFEWVPATPAEDVPSSRLLMLRPETSSATEHPVSAPLTSAQLELWFAVQLGDSASCSFNLPYRIDIRGPLDVGPLKEALQRLVDRHESLRTSFDLNEPVSYLHPHVEAQVAVRSTGPASAEEVSKLAQMEATTAFDIGRAPLFRAQLLSLGKDHHTLLFTIHHLICDGFSIRTLLDELGRDYSHCVIKQPSPDVTAPKYSDYVMRQRELEDGPEGRAAESHFASVFSTIPEDLDLPTDRKRSGDKSLRCGEIRSHIDAITVSALRLFGRSNGCTLFTALLGGFYLLLARISGQNDIVVGIPVAGQLQLGFPGLVGHCVNMPPIRLQIDESLTSAKLVRIVQSAVLDTQEHGHYTMGALLPKLKLPRRADRNPLFAVQFNFEQAREGFKFGNLDASVENIQRKFHMHELALDLAERDGRIQLTCWYNEDLYNRETVENWLDSYRALLTSMASDARSGVGSLEVLSTAQRKRFLARSESSPLDARGGVLGLIDFGVDGNAVTCGPISLSYRDVALRSSEIGSYLVQLGVKRGDIVGVCLERSADLLCTLLGIWRAGGAYLPLDPSFPVDRLNYMLRDSGARFLVTESALKGKLDVGDVKVMKVDDRWKPGDLAPLPDLSDMTESLAYVLYTSGSTGKPKGVLVPHRSVVNFLTSMSREPGLTRSDVFVAVTTTSFDISVLELFLPLVVGARVIIASVEEATDGRKLSNLLASSGATVMQATPSTWRMLLEAGWTDGGRFKVLCGGEPFPPDLARDLLGACGEVWNMYGPTETTIWSTCVRLVDTSNGISIGRPIANTSVYVVDVHHNLCPIGVPGELCIGGAGVTLGYWKRPELTAERFVADPFSTTPGATLYRTGDRARWRSDGSLEHLGRLDDQVKVRGFRVELGEIEAVLAEHPDVRQAAVHLWTVKANDVRIVACCVPAKAGVLAPISLRKHLRARLPEYMIPQHFLPLEEIPLTPSGKVDRRRLPIPVATESPIGRQEAPADAVEAAIAEIWTQLIQPARAIGRNDKFFEMGGHSLLALQALRQMEQKLGVKLDFPVLFLESLVDIAARCRTHLSGSPEPMEMAAR